MVALIPSRTDRKDMHLLGQRIAISQRDEIGLMQHWLEDHHEACPRSTPTMRPHMPGTQMAGMQMPGMGLMPGMLTPEQMSQLASAKGPAFDRLLLQGMIGHHQGALTMVAPLVRHARGRSSTRGLYLCFRRQRRPDRRDQAHAAYVGRNARGSGHQVPAVASVDDGRPATPACGRVRPSPVPVPLSPHFPTQPTTLNSNMRADMRPESSTWHARTRWASDRGDAAGIGCQRIGWHDRSEARTGRIPVWA